MRKLLVGAMAFVPVLMLAAPAEAAAGKAAFGERTARTETPPLHDDEAGGDADADDPAIWVHPSDKARSLVLATAKNGGLRVYDLRGRELQSIATPPAPGPDDEAGRFNNVDLLGDLAVVSDRGRDQLRFYRIDGARGRLVDVTAPGVPFAFSADQAEVNEQRTAYGVATYRDPDGGSYVVVSRRSTPEVGIFRVVKAGHRYTYRKVSGLALPDTFRLPDGTTWTPCADPGDGPQVEGMVVDPATGVAYLAQETVGLWRVPIGAGRFRAAPRVVEHTREYGIPAAFDPDEDDCVVEYDADRGFGGRIAADVEGLTIYRTGWLSGTLLVSSQGDDTFFTYDRLTNRPLSRFAVVDGPRADGSQECDGASVVSTPLPGYPGGLLVVHDGQNTPDVDGRPNTNFKYLDAAFLRRS